MKYWTKFKAHKKKIKTHMKKFKAHMKHLIKYLNQCFQQGFSKNLEISRKNGKSPDLFLEKPGKILQKSKSKSKNRRTQTLYKKIMCYNYWLDYRAPSDNV